MNLPILSKDIYFYIFQFLEIVDIKKFRYFRSRQIRFAIEMFCANNPYRRDCMFDEISDNVTINYITRLIKTGDMKSIIYVMEETNNSRSKILPGLCEMGYLHLLPLEEINIFEIDAMMEGAYRGNQLEVIKWIKTFSDIRSDWVFAAACVGGNFHLTEDIIINNDIITFSYEKVIAHGQPKSLDWLFDNHPIDHPEKLLRSLSNMPSREMIKKLIEICLKCGSDIFNNEYLYELCLTENEDLVQPYIDYTENRYSVLIKCALAGNYDRFKMLYEEIKGDDVGPHELIALMCSACRGGNVEIVRFIINEHTKYEINEDDFWNCGFDSAVCHNHSNIVSLIVRCGKNLDWKLVFETACYFNYQDMILYLYKTGKKNKIEMFTHEECWSIGLDHVCQMGAAGSLIFLIKRGAKITVEHFSNMCRDGFLTLVKVLTNHFNISTEILNKAITAACRAKDHRIVEYLTKCGATHCNWCECPIEEAIHSLTYYAYISAVEDDDDNEVISF